MPVVGRQRKSLKDLPDECVGGWRTTKKLVKKGELVMLRYDSSPFEWEESAFILRSKSHQYPPSSIPALIHQTVLSQRCCPLSYS